MPPAALAAFREDARVNSFRIAVLASGAGTNLQAILDRVHGTDGIEVVGVISDNPDAQAVGRARKAGVETAVFPASEYEGREERDRAIGDWLEGREVDLVVLAGYMQLLSPHFVQRFRNRVINVHPALLPSFPGLEAVQQALDHGSKVTGVTVHFVDEGVDSGPIIFQRAVEIPPSREWDETEEMIHAAEHVLLPEAIRLIAAGRVRIDGDNPRLVHVDPPEER
jgi:phosphoribosylglycinamide formyltransferase 1